MSDADFEQAKMLAKRGMSCRYVAGLLGVAESTLRQYVRFTARRGRKLRPSGDRRHADKLRAAGYTSGEVALVYDVTRQAVDKWRDLDGPRETLEVDVAGEAISGPSLALRGDPPVGLLCLVRMLMRAAEWHDDRAAALGITDDELANLEALLPSDRAPKRLEERGILGL